MVKRDSGKGVVLLILINFLGTPFFTEHLQVTASAQIKW